MSELNKALPAAAPFAWPVRRFRPRGLALVLIALVAAPLIGDDYWLGVILVPFLILSLAGLGLNLLTGYAGQTSLGSGGFMAVGAFATFGFVVHGGPAPVAAPFLFRPLASAP